MSSLAFSRLPILTALIKTVSIAHTSRAVSSTRCDRWLLWLEPNSIVFFENRHLFGQKHDWRFWVSIWISATSKLKNCAQVEFQDTPRRCHLKLITPNSGCDARHLDRSSSSNGASSSFHIILRFLFSFFFFSLLLSVSLGSIDGRLWKWKYG